VLFKLNVVVFRVGPPVGNFPLEWLHALIDWRVSVGDVSLSNSRCKRWTIRKRLKRRKKKGGTLGVNLVKLAKIANSPVLGKDLAEFELVFTNP
jgi:hypothetical protein